MLIFFPGLSLMLLLRSGFLGHLSLRSLLIDIKSVMLLLCLDELLESRDKFLSLNLNSKGSSKRLAVNEAEEDASVQYTIGV